MLLSKPWVSPLPGLGLISEPFLVRPEVVVDWGEMPTILTGPWTHQSSLAKRPTR